MPCGMYTSKTAGKAFLFKAVALIPRRGSGLKCDVKSMIKLLLMFFWTVVFGFRMDYIYHFKMDGYMCVLGVEGWNVEVGLF